MSQSVHESGKRVEMSANLSATLQRAGRYAAEQRHRFVTIEHILLALNEDPEAELMLNACSIDRSRLHNDVLGYLNLLQDRVGLQENAQPVLATEAARIVNSAVIAAEKSRRDKVNGAIVLAAIIGDGKTPAANMLSSQGLTFQAAIEALQATHGHAQTGLPAGQRPASQPLGDRALGVAEHMQARPPRPSGSAPGRDEGAAGAYSATFDAEQRGAHRAAPPQRSAKTGEPASLSQAERLAASSLARFERRPTASQRSRAAQQHSDRPLAADALQPARSSGLGGDPLRRPPPPSENWGSASYPPSPPRAAGTAGRQFDAYGQPGLEPDYRYPHHPARPETNNLPAVVPDEKSWPTRIIRVGQLLENIPRRMRLGISHSVEVRIARAELQNLGVSVRGNANIESHELSIAKVMAVRMRAPDDGFFIEAASPETQWIENWLGPLGDEFASWRWTITPKRSGRATLQLIVSARTVGGDGLAAETALPDQLFDIRISANYAKVLSRWTGWIVAAVIGGILAKFGEDILRIAAIVIRNGTGAGGL